MDVNEFIKIVIKYRQKDNAVRKFHRRSDIIERYELGKMIDRALDEGITVSIAETDDEWKTKYGVTNETHHD